MQTRGYLFVVENHARANELLNNRLSEGSFAESVRDFKNIRTVPLIALGSFQPKTLTHISLAKPGRRSGTRRRRVKVSVRTLEIPHVPFSGLLEALPSETVEEVAGMLNGDGGLLTGEAWRDIRNVLTKHFPEVDAAIEGLIPDRDRAIAGLSLHAREVIAFERESVDASLRMAGFLDPDRERALNWTPGKARQRSFLDGLKAVPLRESQMLINDLHEVPGFRRIDQKVFGAVKFEDKSRKLIVLHANQQRLEETLGVDLIYYNETYRSFVCVQYKAMEEEKRSSVFRFPKKDLETEVARMEKINDVLRNFRNSGDPSCYQLHEIPFYLKFCPRTEFDPDKPDLIRGMYIPIEYWKIIERHPSTKGPRGGRVLTFENAGRYLDNTHFMWLVAHGWVGTHHAQSAVLEKLIRAILASGRSLTVAVKFDKPDSDTAPRFSILNADGTIFTEEAEPAKQQISIRR